MNYNDFSAKRLVDELSIAGEEPHPDLINAVWERRKETEPLLLELFHKSFEDDWPSGDDPRWYRFPHAGKFLLSWQNAEALSTFVRLYSSDDDGILSWCEWFEEDLFHYGPVAIPYLQEVLNTSTTREWHYGKSLASGALTKIATYYPETREQIASVIRAKLPSLDMIATLTQDNANEMWSSHAVELADLADEDSRKQILALLDADLLYDDFIDRPSYLQAMNRGFKPQKSPKPYDVRDDYKRRYEAQQAWLKRQEREKAKEHPQRARQRTEPKVGRNAPCPCGSGKKYKKCHGRPGS